MTAATHPRARLILAAACVLTIAACVAVAAVAAYVGGASW